MINKIQKIETERLFLKITDTADAPFILELMNTPKWHEFIGDRHVHTEEEARNYILNRMTPQFEKLGFSNYPVTRKEDGVKLGTCGLYDRPELEGVDIGFAFLPQFEGYGYASESSQALLDMGVKHFGLLTVKAITLPSNTASRKLLTNLGFAFIEYIRLSGDDDELMLFEYKR